MKVDQKDKVKIMLTEAQNFISEFDELVSNLSFKEIIEYQKTIY